MMMHAFKLTKKLLFKIFNLKGYAAGVSKRLAEDMVVEEIRESEGDK